MKWPTMNWVQASLVELRKILPHFQAVGRGEACYSLSVRLLAKFEAPPASQILFILSRLEEFYTEEQGGGRQLS